MGVIFPKPRFSHRLRAVSAQLTVKLLEGPIEISCDSLCNDAGGAEGAYSSGGLTIAASRFLRPHHTLINIHQSAMARA